MFHVSGYNAVAVYVLGVLTGLLLIVLFDVAADLRARRKMRRK